MGNIVTRLIKYIIVICIMHLAALQKYERKFILINTNDIENIIFIKYELINE